MGRGRVQLKRIENKINRQVTFSKRRNGLLKKAHEISVLCEAEVAVIIFSARGKLYEYSTDSSMDRILDRHQRYTYAEKVLEAEPESQGSLCLEYGRLKSKVEALQKSQRHLMGEQLDTLTLKELQQLEQKLDSALRNLRSRKNQLLFDKVAELERKEKSLQEQNILLSRKLAEKAKALDRHPQLELQNLRQTSPSLSANFVLADSHPTLNIGKRRTYQARDVAREADTAQPLARVGSNSLLPWMLPHVSS